MCSKYDNHSRLNNQHNGGDLYKCLMSMNNLHFDTKHIIHTSSKSYEESGSNLELDLLTISYESRVTRSRRSGLIENVRTMEDPSTLSVQLREVS